MAKKWPLDIMMYLVRMNANFGENKKSKTKYIYVNMVNIEALVI